MAKQWIYILRCQPDLDDGSLLCEMIKDACWSVDNHESFFYIGTTHRLYSRINKHFNGSGALNTCIYEPIEVVAIYDAEKMGRFFQYSEKLLTYPSECWHWYSGIDSLSFLFNFWSNWNRNFYQNNHYTPTWVETMMTECIIGHRKDYDEDKYNTFGSEYAIRGGKYVRTEHDVHNKMVEKCSNNFVKKLPVCKCGLPCDVMKSKKNFLYFRCAKKNMFDAFVDNFDGQIDNNVCNYYQEFIDDIELRIKCKSKADTMHNKSLFETYGTSSPKCLIQDDSDDEFW